MKSCSRVHELSMGAGLGGDRAIHLLLCASVTLWIGQSQSLPAVNCYHLTLQRAVLPALALLRQISTCISPACAACTCLAQADSSCLAPAKRGLYPRQNYRDVKYRLEC